MAAKSLETLITSTNCSVCLDTFLSLKTLPCGHSYCSNCLLPLSRNTGGSVTCPQCRVKHILPEGGISVLPDLMLNEKDRKSDCTDCHGKLSRKSSVKACGHCDKNVCEDCLEVHIKLSTEMNVTLKYLEESLNQTKTSDRQKIRYLESTKIDIQASILHAERLYRNEIEKRLLEVMVLVNRSRMTEDFLNSAVNVCNAMLSTESRSYVSDLSEKTNGCESIKSLKQSKDDLDNVQYIIRLLQSSKDNRFKFSETPSISDVNNIGQIQFGNEAVDIKSHKYRDDCVDQLPSDFYESIVGMFRNAVTAEIEDDLGDLRRYPKTTGPDPRNSATIVHACAPAAQLSRRWTYDFLPQASLSHADWSAPSSLSSSETLCPSLVEVHKARLPSNVNYLNLDKTVPRIIGQGKSASGSLIQPYGCAFHATTNEIFVADNVNNRIMVYDCDKGKGKVFYANVPNPLDVSISTDENYIYVVTGKSLVKLDMDGRLLRTTRAFFLGDLEMCPSVACHGDYTLVVEQDHNCVLVFNENGEDIRRLGMDNLVEPVSVAVSGESEIFVTDNDSSCVRVFSWEGQYRGSFAGLRQNEDIDGITVDADGVCCVARWKSNRIDVYNDQRDLITSVGGPGTSPGQFNGPAGLALLPDGRLIVTDQNNNRLQIFK